MGDATVRLEAWIPELSWRGWPEVRHRGSAKPTGGGRHELGMFVRWGSRPLSGESERGELDGKVGSLAESDFP